jgi:hypothetical protein
MSPELDARLCEKYPKIFENRFGDIRTTAMCWGFECGDGWYNLIDTLCAKIQNYVDERSPEVYPVIATQVKEKYGTLRFYISGGDEHVDNLVSEAERLSALTCETCGEPGKLRGMGWYYVACDSHTQVQDLLDDSSINNF